MRAGFLYFEYAIALPSSPCLPELMVVGEDAIALSSPLCHPEMMEVSEGANVFS